MIRNTRRVFSTLAHRLWAKIPSPQWWLLIGFSLFAVAPFAQPGYFWNAHDARHNVYFLFEFDRSWQDGIFFPRWAPDFAFGYGYPFWVVYAPLATYAGQLFHLLGFGWETSVKFVFSVSVITSGLAMFGFVRSWAGRNAALLAGVAYIFIPYHLVDLYVRGALAESVALVFLPLCLWSFREVTLRPRLSVLTGAILSFAGLMLTSNLVALVFASALGTYLIMHVLLKLNAEQPWRAWSRESIVPLLGNFAHVAGPAALALALGFGISAAFSLPALLEFKFVNRDQWYGEYYNPFNHFVDWFQLFTSNWGFGISEPGPNDSISFQLGAVPLTLSVLGFAYAWRKKRQFFAAHVEAIFFAALTIVAVFLMLPISAWAWQFIPNVKFAQFPWRYLMLSTVGLAVLPALLLARSETSGAVFVHKKLNTAASVLMAALILLGSYNYLRVEITEPTPEQGPVSFAALMRFEQSSHEMTGVSAFTKQIPTWSAMAENHVHGRPVTTHVDYSRVPQNQTLAVDVREHGTAHELVWVHSGEENQRLIFNINYFPGWTAYFYEDNNNQPGRLLKTLALTPTDIVDPHAQIAVPLETGDYFLLLRFEDTPVRVAGKALTIASLLVVLLAWGVRWRVKRARSAA